MNMARIKELRTQLHLSQEYVANYLGVSRSTYTQMENGKRKVLADEVAKLSDLFGVSADSLLNNTNVEYIETIDFAIKAIEVLQAEPKHGKWIKFEDYLPSQKQRVIFLERDNVSQKYNIDIGTFYRKDEKENDYSDSVTITNRKWHATDSRIIAWCPLPPFELATNCGAKMDKGGDTE